MAASAVQICPLQHKKMKMEKFYFGTTRLAKYTYKDSYEDYLNSKQYRKDSRSSNNNG